MTDKPAEEDKETAAEPAPTAKELEIVDVAADGSKKLAGAKSFTVTWKNPETGVAKVGTFTATRPSLGILGKIAVLKAKLNGGERVDFQTDFMHTMMAELHYIITDAPEWWKPDEFFTADPLREVWDHVGAWLNNFLRKRAS